MDRSSCDEIMRSADRMRNDLSKKVQDYPILGADTNADTEIAEHAWLCACIAYDGHEEWEVWV